jgi:hypothetical protein
MTVEFNNLFKCSHENDFTSNWIIFAISETIRSEKLHEISVIAGFPLVRNREEN